MKKIEEKIPFYHFKAVQDIAERWDERIDASTEDVLYRGGRKKKVRAESKHLDLPGGFAKYDMDAILNVIDYNAPPEAVHLESREFSRGSYQDIFMRLKHSVYEKEGIIYHVPETKL